MKGLDIRFFVVEAFRSLRLHLAANAISVICIALALLTLGCLIGAWWNLEHLLGVANADAQIVVYLTDGSTTRDAEILAELLASQAGVDETRVVGSEESMNRVEALLGTGFDLAELLEGQNPFPPSVEVSVTPEEGTRIARFARGLRGVDLIRDNEEILAPLANLTRAVRWMGLVASVAVAVMVLALASHMVRLGISARREEMETLRLMGASEGFVSAPFLLEGGLVGGLGSVTAIVILAFVSPRLYALMHSSLPFLPLLPWADVFQRLSPVLLALGIASGTLGGLVSLKSS